MPDVTEDVYCVAQLSHLYEEDHTKFLYASIVCVFVNVSVCLCVCLCVHVSVSVCPCECVSRLYVGKQWADLPAMQLGPACHTK